MKKFLTLLFVCIFISSCGNQNIQNNQTTSSGEIQVQGDTNSGSIQAAEDTLDEIKNTSQDDISKALQAFLAQESIDYKGEIQKTLERYNDNYGPVLEYKHAIKPQEEEEEEEEEETSTGDTADEQVDKENNDENNDKKEDEDNQNEEIEDKQNYSGETQTEDNGDKTEEQKIDPEFTTITKTGNSGSYTSYEPNGDACNGGLKMTDNQGEEKWLFYNTCDKIIYDFELDFGGINVFYTGKNGTKNETFVTIE